MEIEKNHSPANFVSHVTRISWMEIHLKFIFGHISITFAKDQL